MLFFRVDEKIYERERILPQGMRSLPARESIGGKASVHEREIRLEIRTLKGNKKEIKFAF